MCDPTTPMRLLPLAACLLACLLACTAGTVSAYERAPQVEAYPPPPGSRKSASYAVSAGGRDVFVVRYKDVSYAHFGLAGKSRVTVTTAEQVDEHSVSPKSYAIAAKADGRELTFTLDRPVKLIVNVNDLERLFVFADPVERDPPRPGRGGVKSVLDFGVDPSGKGLQTSAIQRAIDAVSAGRGGGGGGGVLFFPAGRYLTGTLSVKRNVTVYLAPGAIIQGSSDADDYPEDPTGGRVEKSCLLLFDSARNAALVGRGTVDGDGKRVRRKRSAHLIRVRQSSDVLIEGVVLRDPSSWNTHILHSDRVTVRNIKMMNDLSNPNTDGVNPDSSRHVTIEDCFMYCSDDCVANKSTGRYGLLRDTEDILVRNNVFWTRKSAQKIGTETRAGFMRRIVFENNDVVHADRALYIVVKDGATVEDCHFRNIRSEVIGGDKHRKLFLMEISKRGGVGRIRNVTISDWTAEDHGPKPSAIHGYDERHEVSDVTFHNLVIKGRTCRSLEEAGIGSVKFARDIRFTSDDDAR